MKRLSLSSLLMLAFAASASAGPIVVDHSANRTRGLTSDTQVPASAGFPWLLTADDFQVSEAAAIRQVVWWGYYRDDNPPPVETMRLRLFDARPGDGLPGSVLYEERFLNPSRNATGVLIGSQPGSTAVSAEYEFDVGLSTVFSLTANTPYWIEVAQIGDPGTWFVWETAHAELTGVATLSPLIGDWSRFYPQGNRDVAFQLIVPEPRTLVLAWSVLFVLRIRRRG